MGKNVVVYFATAHLFHVYDICPTIKVTNCRHPKRRKYCNNTITSCQKEANQQGNQSISTLKTVELIYFVEKLFYVLIFKKLYIFIFYELYLKFIYMTYFVILNKTNF